MPRTEHTTREEAITPTGVVAGACARWLFMAAAGSCSWPAGVGRRSLRSSSPSPSRTCAGGGPSGRLALLPRTSSGNYWSSRAARGGLRELLRVKPIRQHCRVLPEHLVDHIVGI